MALPRKFILLAGLSAMSTVLFMFISHSSWDSNSLVEGNDAVIPTGDVALPTEWATLPAAVATPRSQEPMNAVTLSEAKDSCNPRIAPALAQMRPLRWLFYQTKEDEQTRGDPFFIILYNGAETSPFIKQSVHWGPGFPHYDDKQSLRENVKQRYGDEEYFDIIFFCGDRKGVVKDQVLHYANSRVLVATRKHECRPKENCAGILGQTKADLSVNVNPFEVALNSELMQLSEKMVLAHVFSPALRSMHFAPVESERPVDGALIGAVSDAYPLRKQWAAVAEKGISGHHLKRYSRPNTWQNKEQKTGSSWLSHFAEYSKKLQTAKMLLTDAAWVFYSVQKYSEAPTAGALLVCDMPHDRMREFRHSSVEVSTKMTNEQLSKTVKWWLDNPEEMREKAMVGQDWALHHVQAAEFFEQLTELYYDQVSVDYGGQGMVGRSFHSPFYVRCRGAGGEAWCKREQKHKEPHYLGRTGAAGISEHPASGGPVPTVRLAASCAGDTTGTIAPHAYKARWGKRNADPNANTALRVLLLQTKEEADRMDGVDPLYRRLLTESDNGYPYAELVRWGPGWDGYRTEGVNLRANVAEKFGSEDYFDMIVTNAGTLPNDTKEYKDKRTVVVLRREECVDDECGTSLGAHAPSIVLLGSPFEILYTTSLHELSRNALLVHAPRTSVPLSEPAGSEVRAVDVLLVVKPADGQRFPMQARWQEAVVTMRSAGVKVETIDGTNGHLVSQLRRSKVVVTESGSRRYMPPEWEDSLGSGCLLLSDMPAERMREFRRFSVEVPRTSSPSQLAQLVERWVQDTEARQLKTLEGYNWATLNASPSHWLDDLVEDYWEVVRVPYGEGLVGKKFPWSFQASCRTEGGERWCKAAPKTIRPHWSLPGYQESEDIGAASAIHETGTALAPAPATSGVTVAPRPISLEAGSQDSEREEMSWKLVRDQGHPTVATWDAGSFADQQCPARVSAGAKFDDVDCGCADDRVDPDPVTSCGQLCAKYYHSHGCRWFYINKRSGADPRYTKKGRCCMKTNVDLTQGWRAPKDLPNYGNSAFYEMLPP